MKHFPYALIALGAIVLFAVYGLPYFGRPNVDRLVEQALNATSQSEQLDAARQLSQLGEPALAGLRQIIADSNNEDVVAVSILGVTRLMDYQSMDQILIRLEDPSLTVRSAAAKSVAKLLGRDHHYPVRGRPEEQARVKNLIVEDWEAYNGSELFEFNQKRLKN